MAQIVAVYDFAMFQCQILSVVDNKGNRFYSCPHQRYTRPNIVIYDLYLSLIWYDLPRSSNPNNNFYFYVKSKVESTDKTQTNNNASRERFRYNRTRSVHGYNPLSPLAAQVVSSAAVRGSVNTDLQCLLISPTTGRSRSTQISGYVYFQLYDCVDCDTFSFDHKSSL